MLSPKMIGLMIGAVLFLAYSFGLFYLGEQRCKAAVNTAVIKAEKKQDQAELKVLKAEAKNEIIYRDRVKVIHDATDNCFIADMPVDVVRSLCAGASGPCPRS